MGQSRNVVVLDLAMVMDLCNDQLRLRVLEASIGIRQPIRRVRDDNSRPCRKRVESLDAVRCAADQAFVPPGPGGGISDQMSQLAPPAKQVQLRVGHDQPQLAQNPLGGLHKLWLGPQHAVASSVRVPEPLDAAGVLLVRLPDHVELAVAAGYRLDIAYALARDVKARQRKVCHVRSRHGLDSGVGITGARGGAGGKEENGPCGPGCSGSNWHSWLTPHGRTRAAVVRLWSPPQRAKSTGTTTMLRKVEVRSPPRMTWAIGLWISLPGFPPARTSGMSARPAVNAVMSTGASRSREPRRTASRREMPSAIRCS